MYKLKHKPIKTTSISISAGLNVVLLVSLCLLTSSFKFHDPLYDCFDCGPWVQSSRLTINVENNKVSILVPDGLRAGTLKNMAELYDIPFSDNEKAEFITKGIVSTSLTGFKTNIFDHYLDQSDTGLPCLPVSGELFDWIKQARIADRNINNRVLLVNICTDHADNPIVQKVEAVLFKQKAGTFGLITNTNAVTLRLNEDGVLEISPYYEPRFYYK